MREVKKDERGQDHDGLEGLYEKFVLYAAARGEMCIVLSHDQTGEEGK